MNSWTHCRPEPQSCAPIGPLTTWGIGGAAQWYAEPRDIIDLAMLLRDAREQRVPVRILGGGSNLLIADGTVGGLVIRLRGAFEEIRAESANARLRCGAGCLLTKALELAEEEGLTGLEHFAGIPGTVGGAVCVNAGAQGHAVGGHVRAVEVMDFDGRTARLEKSDLSFVYRRSNLDGRIITAVELQLEHDFPDPVRLLRRASPRQRPPSQARGPPPAGRVFKTPQGESAGRLIDVTGCKGWREGGIVVSPKHANFLINEDGGTFVDCMRLIGRVQDAVYAAHGIRLELEVRIWQ